MSACPCGSSDYARCCGRFHDGVVPETAEQLMRSRYSAFVKDLRPYLLATWHPDTRPSAIEAPEPGLKWLGLTVRRAWQPEVGRGVVEFVARSKLGGRAHRLHEVSTFVREGGRWLYVRAEA